MIDIFDFMADLSNFSNEDLRALSEKIEKEIKHRKSAERKKLIENFKSAFLALHSAGVDVRVVNGDDEIDFCVHSWDDFYFN